MRIAILSDIHGDLVSLQDAFTHIDRAGCDLIICAGDYVDYGPEPDATLALLEERGVVCIRGNHDRWAVTGVQREVVLEEDNERRKPLTPRALAFLESLPTHWEQTCAGVRVAMWHASPGSDLKAIAPGYTHEAEIRSWLATCAAQVLVVGHTHDASELRLPEGGMIVNPGTMLRTETRGATGRARLGRTWPREGGTFGLLDLPECRFTVHDGRDGRDISQAVLFRAGHVPRT